MKILDLELLAFGPFTDKKIHFTDGQSGLHVLLGPNEAGKSTALRSLRALLYGIEERTADNFLHDNKGLRIGGRLKRSDDSELAFIRLKKRKDSLCTPEGAQIPDELLTEYLGGVTQDQFSRMFGIGYEDLVAGGQEILQGKGEIGEILFAAGIGGKGLQETLKQFDINALELFRARASSSSINKGLAEYSEIKRGIRSLSFSAGEWEKLLSERDKATGGLERLDNSLKELSAEKSRHERMLRVLPKIAERNALLSRLESYISVPELSDEFSDTRKETELRLESAQEDKRTAERDIEELRRDIELIVIPESLLGGTFEIKNITKTLGVINKGDEDLPKRRAVLADLQTRVQALLDEIHPGYPLEKADDLRRGQSKKALINALTDKYHQITGANERIVKELRGAKNELVQTQASLASAAPWRDNSELKRALTFAQKYLNFEDELRGLENELDRAKAGLKLEAERLTLRTGPIDALVNSPVPSEETCMLFESRLSETESEIKMLNTELAKAGKERARLELDLRKLNSGGIIPTVGELSQARDKRDTGWQLIKRAWLGGESIEEEVKLYDPENTLPEAFESDIKVADRLSDDLRTEADSVAANSQLLVGISANSEEQVRLSEELAVANQKLESLNNEWRGIWSGVGIAPLTPKEMRAWLSTLDKIRVMTEQVITKETEIRTKEEGIQSARELLCGSLSALGEEAIRPDEKLHSVIARSQAVVERMDITNSERGDLEKQAKAFSNKIAVLEEESAVSLSQLAEWRTEWAEALRELGLDGNALPAVALTVLTKIDELVNDLNDRRNLENRIAAMEKDRADFEVLVHTLVEEHAPDLAGLPAVRAAEVLVEHLEKAQSDSIRLSSFNKQLLEKRPVLGRSEETLRVMREKLDLLCKTARCETSDQLIEIERCSKEQRELKADLNILERQLLELGEGHSIEELTAAAEYVDPDETRATISDIDRRTDVQKAERDEINQKIGRLTKELEDVNGGSSAADEAEKAAEKLASIRSDVDRYVRYTMASMILKREIERYRQANQDPVLRMAGEFFSMITCGEFSGLLQDTEEDGKPVIVGRRNTGKLLGVEGMSEGTRDQLYLSLRLASLSRYLERNESIPFIVDDILIKFDDKRARAALGILAELSRKTQVIFFTHHSRLAELAKGLGRDDIISVQEF